MNVPAPYHSHLTGFISQLSDQIEGQCDFTDHGVALYTSDASNYRQIPLGVVYPASIDDIVRVSTLCREYDLPVLMRGAGTSQNGQCVNKAVIIDCSRHLNRVLDIDADQKSALIQPGVVCDTLKATAEQQGLTFGPDPATHSRCTLGGMIGNNSCGPRSMLAGKTVENVLELEVLTADGARFWTGPTSDDQLARILEKKDRQAEIYRELIAIRDQYADLIRQRYPDIKRRVSGYNLDQLLPENGFNVARALVGSEGTCVSILQARVNLIKKPELTALTVLGFDDIYTAGDAVRDIMPFSPIAMEGLDWNIVGGLIDRQLKLNEVALLPEGRAWLLVELAGHDKATLEQSVTAFRQAMTSCERVRSVRAVQTDREARSLWSIREQGASATSMSLDPEGIDPVVGWEDTAVDPFQLGDYLREFQALIDRYGYTTSLYGHFGDGCIHARITFDTRSDDGVMQWRAFSEEIARLVVKFGGSLSGEHGDGQAKAEFLPIMFGKELMQAFHRFKRAWDPDARMNPGKLIDAYRMDENLRYGPDYQTPDVPTVLQFTEDPAGLGRSTERCIGMGKCRAHTGAMCPSFQATGNEAWSTRGRAHLLHELVRGETIRDGWQNRDIAESMEHCLSCKACKSECPTQVDIAAYKAEFLHKHHTTVKRPLHHYLVGHIGRWLPLAAKMPSLVNRLQNSLPGRLLGRRLGFSVDRALPMLAHRSFHRWVINHAEHTDQHFFWFGEQDQSVVLWSDTVNAHYRPEVLSGAVEVLNKIGYRVGVARSHFCCGRPLYDFGFLQQARQQLQQILGDFSRHLPADLQVLVLEPSCLSVFKDELIRLFPADSDARALSERTTTLGEFLGELMSDRAITPKHRIENAVLHMHCHSESLGFSSADRQLMELCITNLEEAHTGCCGMAGTFGLRENTRPIAQTLFSKHLRPALQRAGSDTVIVSNGFSCREHFQDNAPGHRVMHPVEVLNTVL